MKSKPILIVVGHVDSGKTTLSAAITHHLASKGLNESVVVVIGVDDLSDKGMGNFDEVYPKEPDKPFVITAMPTQQECYIDIKKPAKPRHNSRRYNGKTKFF